MNNGSIKIALITASLGNGGAERSCAMLSVMLSDLGYDVHIISVLDDIEFEFKGKLLNLGILKKNNDTLLGRLNRLLVLKKYLKQNKIDWVIDNRTRKIAWSEFIISKFIYMPQKTIYVVHSFIVANYFPENNFIAKLIYKKSPYIVAVSNEIKQEIKQVYGYKNVIRIYNPVDLEKAETESASCLINEGQYILAYGRINDAVKNYSLLIEAYSISILPSRAIKLYILGDGNDVDFLKKKVKGLHLQDKIIFKGKQVNPFHYVKNAFFTVLSSRFEGFPRVIIESLSLGIPVVSVNCQSGPKEIIKHQQNGLLVENNNPKMLSKAMNKFVEDARLYAVCKANAKSSVSHLSVQNIAREWQEILK